MCGQDLTWSQLLLHYRDNHNLVMDVRQYRCQACGIDFKNKNLRQNHQNLAHRHMTTYSCEKCGKQFKGGKSKRKLEKHMEKVHMKDSQKRQCQFCKSWFTTPESLANHVRRLHTGETPFKKQMAVAPSTPLPPQNTQGLVPDARNQWIPKANNPLELNK